jgi:acyl-CoA synthetase (AMP-forming)/AMP-acid ligase II
MRTEDDLCSLSRPGIAILSRPPALARDGRLLTFRELHTRVEGIAATITSYGFGVGDRLALLLPNGPDYVAGLRRVFPRRELSFSGCLLP